MASCILPDMGCPYHFTENQLFARGTPVDFVYGWPVGKEGENLPTKMRQEGLWIGYDEDKQHHLVQVTLAENKVEIWKVLDVKLHQKDDAAADQAQYNAIYTKIPKKKRPGSPLKKTILKITKPEITKPEIVIRTPFPSRLLSSPKLQITKQEITKPEITDRIEATEVTVPNKSNASIDVMDDARVGSVTTIGAKRKMASSAI